MYSILWVYNYNLFNICSYIYTNIIFHGIVSDRGIMEGITISEMAKELGLPRKTVEMRLLRRGHKPKSQEAIYSFEAFEDIKNTPSPGRPKNSKAVVKPTKPKPGKKAKPRKEN